MSLKSERCHTSWLASSLGHRSHRLSHYYSRTTSCLLSWMSNEEDLTMTLALTNILFAFWQILVQCHDFLQSPDVTGACRACLQILRLNRCDNLCRLFFWLNVVVTHHGIHSRRGMLNRLKSLQCWCCRSTGFAKVVVHPALNKAPSSLMIPAVVERGGWFVIGSPDLSIGGIYLGAGTPSHWEGQASGIDVCPWFLVFF